ncbi:hypothetical protein L6452_15348 [Arctium lappa]|uniref:Uncharacterized protein n=1 Tax=Arctium lappa TaxID=4217 RepID=A0ACB9CNQ7_ARCLA|nr:hypothetical protein L6452_15348 [Arctium lappa]
MTDIRDGFIRGSEDIVRALKTFSLDVHVRMKTSEMASSEALKTMSEALKTFSLKMFSEVQRMNRRTDDTSLSDKIYFLEFDSKSQFITQASALKFFMANSSISAMYTAGSLTKPPTLLRDEYPQWKIRMVNFLEGMDRDLFRFVNVGPHIPMVLVPRVPATTDTAEIPAYYEKKTTNFTDEENNMMDNDSKAVRLLIMAIPNDIFQELDSCKTAKEIWDQLLNQLEGGLQTQKNRRNLCINEYHDFHALPEEKLHQTYSRFNILINKCRKFGVIRTKEENNVLFFKSLNEEWSQLSMSIQANQDLESWSLTDIYDSDEDINAFAKSLALITHQFNKKFGKKVFEGRRENEERRNPERRFQQEPRFTPYSDQKGANFNHENATPQTRPQQPFQPRYPQPQRYFKPQEQKPETSSTTFPPNQNDGRCFRCGKSGHFSANCRGKLVKDQDYYKNK